MKCGNENEWCTSTWLCQCYLIDKSNVWNCTKTKLIWTSYDNTLKNAQTACQSGISILF